MKKYAVRRRRRVGRKSSGKRLRKVINKQIKSAFLRQSRDLVTDFNSTTGTLPVVFSSVSAVAGFNVFTNFLPYAAPGGDNKTGRLGTDLLLRNIQLRMVLSTTPFKDDVFRCIVARWVSNDNENMNASEIVQSNATGDAAISLRQYNCPYQILYDRKIVIRNADGTGPQRTLFQMNLTSRKGWPVRFTEGSITSAYDSIEKGLVRVFFVCQNLETTVVAGNVRIQCREVFGTHP